MWALGKFLLQLYLLMVKNVWNTMANVLIRTEQRDISITLDNYNGGCLHHVLDRTQKYTQIETNTCISARIDPQTGAHYDNVLRTSL